MIGDITSYKVRAGAPPTCAPRLAAPHCTLRPRSPSRRRAPSQASPGLSYCVYTQTTDVENECDGMVSMDRSAKFSADQVAAIKAANLALTTTQTQA